MDNICRIVEELRQEVLVELADVQRKMENTVGRFKELNAKAQNLERINELTEEIQGLLHEGE